MFRRKIISLISILAAILLVSSATATIHMKSTLTMNVIKNIEEKNLKLEKENTLNLLHGLIKNEKFKNLVKKLSKPLRQKLFNGKIVDINIKKFKRIIEKYRFLLKSKLGISLKLESLKDRIKKLLDKAQPQLVGTMGILSIYIIGWIITFIFYFLTTPSADWLERLGISLVAATI